MKFKIACHPYIYSAKCADDHLLFSLSFINPLHAVDVYPRLKMLPTFLS